MEYLGVVIEIKENKAFVITNNCEIFCIRRQPGMYQGLEVVFERSEIINKMKTTLQRSAIAAVVAAVFVTVFCFVSLFNSSKIYAYIDIDINTNWEFVVDKENRVIDMRTIDKNSEILFDELNLKKKPLEVAVVEMVEKLDETGVIDFKTDNKVLITACIKNEVAEQQEKNGLQLSYGKIKEELSSINVEPYFMKIGSDDRKSAVDNKLSMGRYSILKLGKEQGIDLDIETLKHSKVKEIVERIGFGKKSENSLIDIDKTPAGNQNTTDVSGNKEIDDKKIEDKKIEDKKNGNVINDSKDGEGVSADLSIDVISDIDNIEAIENANKKTQKIIDEIQQEVKNNIALETDKTNVEISRIKANVSLSEEEKNKKIKQLEAELVKRIRNIKQVGNEKAQEELNKLYQKANDLLP